MRFMRLGPGRRFVVAGVAGCALVVLGAAGTSAARLHSSGDAEATLTVTITGAGTGVIQSTPQGINCSTICSAQFPINTDVALKAQSTHRLNVRGLVDRVRQRLRLDDARRRRRQLLRDPPRGRHGC